MQPGGLFSGERVEVSGIYRSVHYAHRWDDVEHVFLKGQEFPACNKCRDCEFILVKAAPSAAEIPEFSAQQTNGNGVEKTSTPQSNGAAAQHLDSPKRNHGKLSSPAA